jgi:hypothetical protein
MQKWVVRLAIPLLVYPCLYGQRAATPTPTLALAAHVEGQRGSLQFLCGVQAPYGEWNPLAQFLAGMGTNGYSLTPEQRASWTRHAEITNASWAAEQSRYLNRIDNWRRRAFDKRRAADVAFYPFSGPDAANVFMFFPDAREYVMIGLEPVGCVPAGLADYTPQYFSALRRSLVASLTLNFFRTNDMQRDFGADSLRGVLPALLFLIARSGYTVASVTPISILADGTLERARDEVKPETSGVEIQFSDGQRMRRLRYFSLNLNNARLAKKHGTMNYLGSLPESDTLVKSASYLLHRASFSVIRDTILTKSRLIVEDDSGIPYRFFDPSAWDVRLNGTYSAPIELFSNWQQEDLKNAFDSRKDVQPLDFAIGYRHVKESNLLVVSRRGK